MKVQYGNPIERAAGRTVPWDRRPTFAWPEVGLTDKEAKRFSFCKFIRAQYSGEWGGAEFEREASEAAGKLLGRAPRGMVVPADVMRRDLNATTDAQGGHLVGTNLMAADFITLLRSKMVVQALGARVMAGLRGDIAVPKALTGSTAYWLNDSTDIPSESALTFGQVGMRPKTLGAYSDISRKLLLQSSIDVENYVRNELATTLALEIDRAAINGSGSGEEPRGIMNVVGIGAVTGGTNGKAPTHQDLVALESELATDNADVGSLAYLTNAKVRGKLKLSFLNATYGERPVWQPDPMGRPGFGEVNGYAAACSNQVPSTLTKGSSNACSAIIFGDWSSLLVAQWGSLDVLVDRTSGGLKGAVRIITFIDVDIAVKRAESFAVMADALTT